MHSARLRELYIEAWGKTVSKSTMPRYTTLFIFKVPMIVITYRSRSVLTVIPPSGCHASSFILTE
jgi:hypothetical protein